MMCAGSTGDDVLTIIAGLNNASIELGAGTGDKLRVRNAGSASADIPVIIIGTSA